MVEDGPESETGAIWCPAMWPYRLTEDQLPSYLQVLREILRTAQFRTRGGWGKQVAGLMHETLTLPAEWSVLPLRSGTEALTLALRAVGVRPGDYVGVPDLAYHAVAMSVLQIGAQPLWLDVDHRTWNLTQRTLAVHGNRVPQAVIGVDNFGSPCDWEGISACCRRWQIPFILDSCESLGAHHPDGSPSNYADLVVHSFSFAKPIHAAGAGGALSGPSSLVERIRPLPEFGIWPTTIPEINAAFLVHAWDDLGSAVQHLIRLYRAYDDGLRELGVVSQELLSGATASWTLAPFRFPKDTWKIGVPELARYLARHGIGSRRAFPPQSSLFKRTPGPPIAARLHEEVLCLPTGASMPVESAGAVIERLHDVLPNVG